MSEITPNTIRLEDLKDFDTWKAWKNGEIELDLTPRTINEHGDHDNLTLFKNEYDEIKGQFVISSDGVYRFIGVAEDEEDYYYVLYDGREIRLTTCLTRLTRLKGFIDQRDYNEMVRLAKINHFDQPTLWMTKETEKMLEFNEQHKTELLTKWDEKTKFIVGPYWEIN